jgi:hypothetical protein
MPDQEHRFVFARSVITHDQILLAIIWAPDLEVTIRETGIAKTLCHGFCCSTHVANRIGGVDFDQLLKDVVRELLGRIIKLSAATTAKECRTKQ